MGEGTASHYVKEEEDAGGNTYFVMYDFHYILAELRSHQSSSPHGKLAADSDETVLYFPSIG